MRYFSLSLLVLLLITLPFLGKASQTVQQLYTRATGTKANITIDIERKLGSINQSWNSYAQGGEESVNMIAPVVSQVQELSPQYIRIDHLYDRNSIVNRDGSGNLTYDFSTLDEMVRSILQTGATPFFALSYMPPAISEGDIIDKPRDWNEWQQVVRRTIEHYSGRNELNISDVYYEVWNEPDLFGNWRYYGDKNYLTLYTYASIGAQNAQNTNSFKFGGPATTQLYKNWITTLVKHVTNNDLRLDFISWHRYDLDPIKFNEDAADLNNWLKDFPEYADLPKVISEWGFDPEINGGYDTNFAAAHAVASARQMLDFYDINFAFEIVDGPDPANQTFWGRWGLLTHPTKESIKKPRFGAFKMLNQITGTRLYVDGEGTWTTAIASIDKDLNIRVMLVNYDRYSKNIEPVPLTLTNMENGTYELIRQRLGEKTSSQKIMIDNNTYSTEVIMLKNSVTLFQFTPLDTRSINTLNTLKNLKNPSIKESTPSATNKATPSTLPSIISSPTPSPTSLSPFPI